MLTYKLNLSPSMKRLDCKFFNPKEKELELKNCENYIFESLSKFVEISGGKRLNKGALLDKDGIVYSIPYIRGEDLNNNIIDFNSAAKISEEDHKSIQNYTLKSNDICISNVGTIGSIGFVIENKKCNFSENMARLRIKDNSIILPEYLFYYLLSDFAQKQFNKYYVGSIQYKLSLDSLRNECKLLVPILNGKVDYKKQQEIIDEIKNILNLQFDIEKRIDRESCELNNIVEDTLKIQDCSKMKRNKFIKCNLHEERLDVLYNNPGYLELKKYLTEIDAITLNDCLEKNTFKEKRVKQYYNVVDLENIDEKLGLIKDYKQVEILESDKIQLNENCILISKMQTDKNKVAIVEKEFEGMCGSSELLQYKIKKGFDIDYIVAAIRTRIVKQQWEYSITGSSRMRINDDIILKSIIPYPKDKRIRDDIVNKIKKKTLLIKELRSELNDVNKIVTEIFNKYFNITTQQ